MHSTHIIKFNVIVCVDRRIDLDNYIFNDPYKTQIMVEGSYKKLKSYLYYDKTLLFVKHKLAEFECDRKNFELSLSKIQDALITKNEKYFDNLIDKIGYVVLPKKFASCYENVGITNGSADQNKHISSVNFFIDMPIELHIIDFLWTLLIGKIFDGNSIYYDYSNATRFKKSLYNNNRDLYHGTDFNSNRCFEPYFNLYNDWRDGAFKAIEDNHKDKNLMLLCLDLKSFYYSVEYKFDTLKSTINDDRINQFEFLTHQIEKIYSLYTKILSSVKKGIYNSKDSCIFPIGVVSVFVLRELYLYKLDKSITDKLSTLYYKRYVDDILIVIERENLNDEIKEDVVNELLVRTAIVRKIRNNNEELKFNNFDNIKIQGEKVNCFFFEKNKKLVLLDILYETLKQNSSEHNLLPDVDIISSSFTQNAYTVKNLDLSNKIRDLGLVLNNNYQATKFINALQKLLKNTNVEKESVSKYFDQIEEFFQGSQCLEYSNMWRSIFELYVLCQEPKRGNLLYKTIVNQIDNVKLENINQDEIQKKAINTIKERLKNDLRTKLMISISLASALNLNFIKQKNAVLYSSIFRESNMLNHNLVSFPLLNYSKTYRSSLVEQNLSDIYKSCLNANAFEFDDFKIKWSPRFIHNDEIIIAKLLKNAMDNKKTKSANINEAFDLFVNYNFLNYITNDIVLDFGRNDNDYHVKNYTINYKAFKKNNPKIALVNTNVSKEDVVDSIIGTGSHLSVENKLRAFNALNIAKKEKTDFIVFPEFYMPIQWLLDVSRFAVENNFSVITGLQYIVAKNIAFNNVCVISPVLSSGYFSLGIIQFREKNHYAPEEKTTLSKLGLKCFDNKNPLYHIFDNGKYSFSVILCYEFTDIYARAKMKSNVDLLFVPQLNKDTNYFSSIVESVARDLHCFVVQANTSEYGDSRITGPYKTQEKNLLLIKGGETDVVMIETPDIIDLKSSRTYYEDILKNNIDKCLSCTYDKKNRINNECKTCKKMKSYDGKVKSPPPLF